MAKNIAGEVSSLVEPIATALGYTIWDVEFVKEGSSMVLRITIDSESGITIDDCEKFHRSIDPILDEADPIEDAYNLEVSSPGIERLLTRPEHFEKMKGSEIEVRLYAPLKSVPSLGNSRLFNGILEGFEDGNIIVRISENEVISLPKKSASKVTTVYDWDNDPDGLFGDEDDEGEEFDSDETEE